MLIAQHLNKNLATEPCHFSVSVLSFNSIKPSKMCTSHTLHVYSDNIRTAFVFFVLSVLLTCSFPLLSNTEVFVYFPAMGVPF